MDELKQGNDSSRSGKVSSGCVGGQVEEYTPKPLSPEANNTKIYARALCHIILRSQSYTSTGLYVIASVIYRKTINLETHPNPKP